jgi:hypothetical protein
MLFFDHVGDAVGERPGFPGARAGDHQNRAVSGFHGFLLLFV